MQIEEGKYYKTRDGRKVGPMLGWLELFEAKGFGAIGGGDQLWNADGSVNDIREGEDGHTIIAEWPTGPVVTELVQKTRIVPGVYDGVTVSDHPEGVLVRIGGIATGDPARLDAAAAVLSALAKGLRDA